MRNSSIIIPARLQSSRLQEKLLRKIGNQTVIERTFQSCKRNEENIPVFMAVDSKKLFDHCKTFTDEVFMTSEKARNGTERILELIDRVESKYYINVQGDEPFIAAENISKIHHALMSGEHDIVSAYSKFKDSSFENPNTVKVITDTFENAIYFSRFAIPFDREKKIKPHDLKKHIGIYGYKRDFLKIFDFKKNLF